MNGNRLGKGIGERYIMPRSSSSSRLQGRDVQKAIEEIDNARCRTSKTDCSRNPAYGLAGVMEVACSTKRTAEEMVDTKSKKCSHEGCSSRGARRKTSVLSMPHHEGRSESYQNKEIQG